MKKIDATSFLCGSEIIKIFLPLVALTIQVLISRLEAPRVLQLKYQTFTMGAPSGEDPDYAIHAIQLNLLTYCPPSAHFTTRVTTFKLSHI